MAVLGHSSMAIPDFSCQFPPSKLHARIVSRPSCRKRRPPTFTKSVDGDCGNKALFPRLDLQGSEFRSERHNVDRKDLTSLLGHGQFFTLHTLKVSRTLAFLVRHCELWVVRSHSQCSIRYMLYVICYVICHLYIDPALLYKISTCGNIKRWVHMKI
jgi:hypothetical protein